MKTIVSFGSRRKPPFGRLALFIWATSLLLTAVLAVLTAWMAVEQSDPLSVMLAILAVVCLVVGREAWRFTWTK
jgi:hypothetical protein